MTIATACHVRCTMSVAHSLAYTVVSGAPIRNHLGTVKLVEVSAGTEVTWHVRATPTIRGVDRLVVRDGSSTGSLRAQFPSLNETERRRPARFGLSHLLIFELSGALAGVSPLALRAQGRRSGRLPGTAIRRWIRGRWPGSSARAFQRSAYARQSPRRSACVQTLSRP